MKVIDLLNKIANDEEIPKYVKYRNYITGSFDTMLVCKENLIYKLDQLEIYLNDEVEITEENKKIEELKVLPYEKCIHEVTHKEKEILLEIRDLQIAFNEIIGVINNVKHRRD